MSTDLEKLLEPSVTAMGCELLGIDYRPHAHGGLLRLYIDKPGGVEVEDCTKVSHQVSGILDVEDPVPGQYSLEVTSPGLDRPLFKLSHFTAFIGDVVLVQTSMPVEGSRKFKGELLEVKDDSVVVRVDGQDYDIPYSLVKKARLVPQFDSGRKGK